MTAARKPILCLDLDGVLHSYSSGWLGADRLPDPPVPGTMLAVQAYVDRFRVAVYSSRSGQRGGVHAMRAWLHVHLVAELGADEGSRVFDIVEWPLEKPPALVTIDDRALTFDGTWPSVESLAAFEPWNKRDVEAERAAAFKALAGAIAAGCDADLPGTTWEGLAARGYRITRI